MFTDDRSMLKVFKGKNTGSAVDSGDLSYSNSDQTRVFLKSPSTYQFAMVKISTDSTDSEFAV